MVAKHLLFPKSCAVLGAGCWVLGAGCWVLGAGCWVLGAGCYALCGNQWRTVVPVLSVEVRSFSVVMIIEQDL
jgi:hypothetical protein